MTTQSPFDEVERPRSVDETSLTLLDQTQAYLESLLRAQAPNTVLVDAWIEFYRLYNRLIRRYVMHLRVPSEEVDDCIQEVWMAIAKNLTNFEHPRDRPGLRAWLYTLVRNKTTDVIRKRARETMSSLDALSEPAAVEQESHNVWERLMIQAIISEVLASETEMDCRILNMRLFEGRSSAEVAAEFGVTSATVRNRLKNILRRLQRRWEFYTGQPLDASARVKDA